MVADQFLLSAFATYISLTRRRQVPFCRDQLIWRVSDPPYSGAVDWLAGSEDCVNS